MDDFSLAMKKTSKFVYVLLSFGVVSKMFFIFSIVLGWFYLLTDLCSKQCSSILQNVLQI